MVALGRTKVWPRDSTAAARWPAGNSEQGLSVRGYAVAAR